MHGWWFLNSSLAIVLHLQYRFKIKICCLTVLFGRIPPTINQGALVSSEETTRHEGSPGNEQNIQPQCEDRLDHPDGDFELELSEAVLQRSP